MKRFALPLALIFLIAVMLYTGKAEANEPRIVREISFVPCHGNPLYLFVFDSGSVAIFDLRLVTEHEETRSVFLRYLDKAKADTTLKEIVLRQECPKAEGADT